MNYYVKEVNSSSEKDDFVRLPYIIYKDNPYYVPDLESDVRGFLSQKANQNAGSYQVEAFNAYDYDHRIVGRVVAVINHKANTIWKQKCVRFGMIEFIDDKEVSRQLIEAVERWGAFHGMNRIQGPLGMTDFDKEGMLMESFNEVGSMVAIYNPPYYPVHMEKLGFQKEVDWVQVRFDVPSAVPERFSRVASVVSKMFNLHIRRLTKIDINKRGYGQRVFDLLNKAYQPLFGFSELSPETCQRFINQYFPLADLRMIPVVEDTDGNIVAAAITIGSLSNALRKSKGRLLPLGWWYFIKSLKIKHEPKVELLLIAVDPKYQGKGVNALIFDDLIRVCGQLGYKWAETGPMLENNMKVLSQWKDLHPQVYKRRRCFGKDIALKKYIRR